jgi:hypothetical protein
MDRIVEQADIIIYHHISRYISIDMCAAQRLCRGYGRYGHSTIIRDSLYVESKALYTINGDMTIWASHP